MGYFRTRERGELKGGILRILREADEPLSAKEVQARCTGHTPAYTTVMTALDRLQKSGEVTRVGEPTLNLRFAPTQSGVEYASETMKAALDDSNNRELALLQFAGNLDSQDLDLLRKAIGRKRAPEPRRK